jgi:hypothetical protein
VSARFYPGVAAAIAATWIRLYAISAVYDSDYNSFSLYQDADNLLRSNWIIRGILGRPAQKAPGAAPNGSLRKGVGR